jgi:hypothetical protein
MPLIRAFQWASNEGKPRALGIGRRGFSSQLAHSCLPRLSGDLVSCESMCWVRRAARGGSRRARVRPKTQAELRQQQSAVGHNPLMLVTAALLSRMGYGR